jgi:hypothetical protein
VSLSIYRRHGKKCPYPTPRAEQPRLSEALLHLGRRLACGRAHPEGVGPHPLGSRRHSGARLCKARLSPASVCVVRTASSRLRTRPSSDSVDASGA